jgi:S1-C subfamily serine protease
MRRRLTAALLLLAALIPAGVPAQVRPEDGPTAEVLARVAPAVLRVSGLGCQGGDRGGSGFAWEQPGRVVTALHVVAGCREIRVSYQGSAERTARLSRALRDADLALLEVANPPAVAALRLTERVPAVNETVQVYGYPIGVATRDAAALRVTAANAEAPKLDQALNEAARASLRSVGMPSLAAEVLRVSGHLLPGHSGAPLVDFEGRVVGVGSGGLQLGAAGIGWAMRAHYVAGLPRAPADLGEARSAVAQAAFAFRTAPASSTTAEGMRCGDITLVKGRTLRLDALREGVDDTEAVDALLREIAFEESVLRAMRFDVWTEAASGVGVVLPQGGELLAGPGHCRAKLLPGVVELVVTGQRLPDMAATLDRLQRLAERNADAAEREAANSPVLARIAQLQETFNAGIEDLQERVMTELLGTNRESEDHRDDLEFETELAAPDYVAASRSVTEIKPAQGPMAALVHNGLLSRDTQAVIFVVDKRWGVERRAAAENRLSAAAVLGAWLSTFPPRQ